MNNAANRTLSNIFSFRFNIFPVALLLFLLAFEMLHIVDSPSVQDNEKKTDKL